MNLRYALFFFITAACGCGANAQITLNDPENVPLIGDTFTYSTAAYSAPPAGGADQIFDYSALVAAGTSDFIWADTVAYSNGSIFAAAGAEMMASHGTDTVFYTVTSAGLERAGEFKRLIVFGNPVDLEISHTNNMLELALPLTYNDQWSDAVAGVVTSDGSTGDRNGLINGFAEGSGTIILPGLAQPMPVVRVFTNLQEVINIAVNGIPTSITHKRKQYDYYAPFLKMPVLTAFTDTLDSQFVDLYDSGIRWMNSSPVGMEEPTSGPIVGLAPNPASDNVVMTLDLPTVAGAVLLISDATGRTVVTDRLPAGTRRWDLDTQQLSSGCYSVTVLDKNGSHGSARLVKR